MIYRMQTDADTSSQLSSPERSSALCTRVGVSQVEGVTELIDWRCQSEARGMIAGHRSMRSQYDRGGVAIVLRPYLAHSDERRTRPELVRLWDATKPVRRPGLRPPRHDARRTHARRRIQWYVSFLYVRDFTFALTLLYRRHGWWLERPLGCRSLPRGRLEVRNKGCNYHNFANNTSCLRPGGVPPSGHCRRQRWNEIARGGR